ncbi:MAG: hypothetical protein LBK66_01025 [Spirochaetaceae bacterium]|jgi:hypothetical protein|nr:hypothetical protein [Spirochaetaceae bacterium]
MRWIFFVLSMGLCISAFGQNDGDNIVGRWRNERERQTFQFNADGTFIMSADYEEVERAMREEQAGEGEVWTDRLSGTYTVTGKSVEMILSADGGVHKMKMTRVNANTLRMYFQNYIRVTEDKQ